MLALEGKKVGIIGTGSTSAQIVGEITKKVGHMTVFQRTPHWVAPLPQKKYSAGWKALLRACPWIHPFLSNFYKGHMLKSFAKATIGDVKEQTKIQQACLQNLDKQVPDPELRARFSNKMLEACGLDD